MTPSEAEDQNASPAVANVQQTERGQADGRVPSSSGTTSGRRRRSTKPLTTTVDITYVNGEAAELLAQVQYAAIAEVLMWVCQHSQHKDRAT